MQTACESWLPSWERWCRYELCKALPASTRQCQTWLQLPMQELPRLVQKLAQQPGLLAELAAEQQGLRDNTHLQVCPCASSSACYLSKQADDHWASILAAAGGWWYREPTAARCSSRA